MKWRLRCMSLDHLEESGGLVAERPVADPGEPGGLADRGLLVERGGVVEVDAPAAAGAVRLPAALEVILGVEGAAVELAGGRRDVAVAERRAVGERAVGAVGVAVVRQG